MDVTRKVFSVKQEVVADDVECQARAPVGNWVIGGGGGGGSDSVCFLSITLLLLLGFVLLPLYDHK